MEKELKQLGMVAASALIVAIIVTTTVLLIAKQIGSPTFSINQVSTSKSDTFTVTGESEVSVTPDEAQVNVGVTHREATVIDAQNKVNTTSKSIKEELIKLGVEEKDIKTTNYSVYPEYDYNYMSDGGSKIIGYNVSTTLNVKTKDFQKLNVIIDKSTELGANSVDGVSFSISDEKMEELETTARKDAFEKAESKAKEITSLSGMKLGRILNVQESSPTTPYPMYYDSYTTADRAGAPESTEISPGSTQFTYTVVVSYETL